MVNTVVITLTYKKKEKNDIGSLCNWYESHLSSCSDKLCFQPSHLYTIGYVSVEKYVCSISDSLLLSEEGYAFSILLKTFKVL